MASASIIQTSDLQRIPWSSLQVDKLIGIGSFGEVHLGNWKGKQVAIKKLFVQKLPEDLIREFKNEAKTMAQCSQCDQIVKLFGVCLQDGHYALIMQYITNGSLYDMLRDSKRDLPWKPLRLRIAKDIGKGLAFLHERDILHRDLKSLNVMLDENLNAKICDFGQAKVKTETSNIATLSKHTAGTIQWHAPELWINDPPKHSKASDIYSYGMILWEIASRKIPYSAAVNSFMVVVWLKEGKQEVIPADCPKEYRSLIEQAWALNPASRPSAIDLVKSLEKIEETFTSALMINHTEQLVEVLENKSIALSSSLENEDYLKGYSFINAQDPLKYSEAVELFKNAAKNGHALSSYELGNCYREGKGVQRDDLIAFKFYLAAADYNHIESLYLVGQCYKNAIGVERDYIKAIEYTKYAAKEGHPEALDYLGHCYFNGYSLKKNYDKAFKNFKLAEQQGNESSRYYLALCYRNGYGVKRDVNEAFKLWKLLADNDNIGAQYEVSQCYKNGEGVDQNFSLAVQYSLLAANQGHTLAQDYIGHCYYQGYTLPHDFSKAVQYFKLAAARDNPSSLEYLAICYAEGKGIQKDPSLAAKYYCRAADLGMKQSQYAIGHACMEGIGIKKDISRAKYYLKLAADQGVKEAKKLLEDLK